MANARFGTRLDVLGFNCIRLRVLTPCGCFILKADATHPHRQPLLHHLLKRSITPNFILGFCLGRGAGLSL